jgi:hypothetical protein
MADSSRFDELWALLVGSAGPDELTPQLLCQATVEHLDLCAAAITVPADLLAAQTIGAHGRQGRLLEELQVTLGEGPSLDGLAGPDPVLVEDIELPAYRARWPLFVPAAAQTGLRSLCVLPMRVGAARVGVLALYLDRVGGLDHRHNADARILARIALELLLGHARAGHAEGDGDPSRDRLFFNDRPEIHQATGMVSAQLGVDPATALIRLRGRAFAEGRLLSELALEVVVLKTRFDEGEQL